jgi:glycosyltransferase involved in cell wall biosynthesis
MKHPPEDRVLVCLPTYHSKSEWIRRAVDSLKKQTYTNFDCWIVKDGCTKACAFHTHYSENTCLECDNCKETCSVCKDIVENDPRFSFHIMPINFSGAGWGPRNYAILNTEHELIAYLDDDNWFEQNHLEELYKAITINKADLAYTGTRLWNADGTFAWDRLHSGPPAAGWIDTSEIMHRRHLIYKYGGWRYCSKCCDWDLVKRWVPEVTWCHTGKITLNFYLRKNCGVHRA